MTDEQEFEKMIESTTENRERKRFCCYYKGRMVVMWGARNVYISPGTAKRALEKHLYQKDKKMIEAFIASGDLEIREV